MPAPRQNAVNDGTTIPTTRTTRSRLAKAKRGFRSGAATGGNVTPAAMPGLSVVDAVGFSRDLHALCNKYGIAWDDAILGGKAR